MSTKQERILITGMGICSPLGSTLPEVVAALREGRSGVRRIQSFDSAKLHMQFAGEVPEIPEPERFPENAYRIWDRGTRMAMHAAQAALEDAGLFPTGQRANRIGVCCGTSGSGQYQNARFRLNRSLPIDQTTAFFLSRNAPHFQSSQVAAQFGIRGPNLAVGSATAGGGIALLNALSWLRNHRVDAVLVGGSESFSLLNVIGFDQLGLSSKDVCTPFSGQPGMTFGEGAGYVVLERESDASTRKADAHAVLAGAAVQADAFDPILFDPSGDGQARTIRAALEDAGLKPESIDWIKASGTGGRDQDLAESLAIRATFETPPPVSSIEPYVGHANGAGPMIGLVAAVLCLKNSFVPSTLGCTEPRAGCDLDYVPEGTRFIEAKRVLCNTAAFGGVNCASIIEKLCTTREFGASVATAPMPSEHKRGARTCKSNVVKNEETPAAVSITGVGIVSSLGCGNLEVLNGSDFATSDEKDPRFSASQRNDLAVGAVRNFSARKLCPTIGLRGVEPLTRYAAAAVSLALKQANIQRDALVPDRVGIVTALARSSGSVFSQLFKELQADGFRPTVGRLMLRNGRFMLASQLAHWFGLKGYSCSISLGSGCGLSALAVAYDQLLSNSSLDAMVVVAADELSPLVLDLMDLGGSLAKERASALPYSEQSTGIMPAEGGVALVVERSSFASLRGASSLARLAGAHSNFDGVPGGNAYGELTSPVWEAQSDETVLTSCIERACNDARVYPEQINYVLGNGCGIWHRDAREMLAVDRMFPNPPAYGSVNSRTGFCESSSSLLNVAAAIQACRTGAFSETMTGTLDAKTVQATETRRALVVASTEHGHNALGVLESEKEGVA